MASYARIDSIPVDGPVRESAVVNNTLSLRFS
jgi:hypothetical protein